MVIELSEKNLKIILDSLLEGIAFDNDSNDIKEVYNLIVSQSNLDNYEKLR